MNSRQEIIDELNNLGSILPQLHYPAGIPEGYFDALPQKVINNIEAEVPFFLTGISKETFIVPEGYFDTLADNIAGIAAGNAENILPRTTAPFIVPAKYFDELPVVTLQKVKAAAPKEQKAQVYTLPFWKKLSVAAAAVVFFAIGLTAFHTDMKNSRIAAKASQKLSRISTETVNEYVAQNIDEFDGDDIVSLGTGYPSATVINHHVNKKDIEEYLNENNWNDL